MKKEEINLDNFFRDTLNNLDNIEPAGSWDEINRKLQQKKNRIFVVYRSLAAGLVFFLSSIFMYQLFDGNKDHNNTRQAAIKTTNTPKDHYASNQLPSSTISNNKRDIHQVSQHDHQAKTGKLAHKQNMVNGITDSLFPYREEYPVSSVPKQVLAANDDTTLQPKSLAKATAHMSEPELNDEEHRSKRLRAGIKIGYQNGANQHSIRSTVLTQFFEYEISHKLAVSAQPTLALNHIDNTSLLKGNPYYSNQTTSVETSSEISPEGDVSYNHNIVTTYDSISLNYKVASNFWHSELPLYLHYKPFKKFSLLTGVALRYSAAIRIYEDRHVSRQTALQQLENSNEYISEDEINHLLGNSMPGVEFNNEIQKKYLESGSPTFSVLYGLGINYKLSNRFGLELLWNKNVSDFKDIKVNKVKEIHQQSFGRFSILYVF